VKTARLFLSLLSLTLLLVLGLAQSAQATVESDAAAPFESIAEISEEDEAEEEECAEASDEAEEECEAEADESGASSGEECLLRTARARIVAFPAHNRVRLTLGYTAFAPAHATVEYLVKQNRLGAGDRSLGRSGVVRLSQHLGDNEMGRLQASHRLTVVVRIPGVPQRCEQLETYRLALEHSSDSRVTWSQD